MSFLIGIYIGGCIVYIMISWIYNDLIYSWQEAFLWPINFIEEIIKKIKN
jgi:hypothetical protein